jgi:hypothetical protein
VRALSPRFRPTSHRSLLYRTAWVALRRSYIRDFVQGGMPSTIAEVEKLNLPNLLPAADLPPFVDALGTEVTGEVLCGFAAKAGSYNALPV